MLSKQLERMLIDTRNKIVKECEAAEIVLHNDIAAMKDGIDRDQLIVHLTQFRTLRKILNG